MNIMYKVCKRVIERGEYPEDMEMRINIFCGAGLISIEERSELLGML